MSLLFFRKKATQQPTAASPAPAPDALKNLTCPYEKMVAYAQRERLALPLDIIDEAEPLFAIETHMSFHERRALLLSALALPDGFTACEVGSYFGASTAFIALAAKLKNGTVHAVDTWQNDLMGLEPSIDTFGIFSRNTARFAQQIKPHRGTSNAMAAEIPNDLDFLFIDGGHTYEQVATDVRNYASKVKKGGLVAMHDYYGDVQQATESWQDYNRLTPYAHEGCLKVFKVI